ncbi:hypothetical protein GCM10011579_038710 [Streptomyces albiflavescens]|uniref:Uncharacterized protein n=1 Tax=Streptomyces albiflavescens TaxID=1623582 RepID=A0A917Y4Q4_9ACTN|nr:hypothetical protein [Streptomyces albiflavescens]GGN66855.1 hypothetical protein GCM10011579_038710 [Streptomyces albiflavescens]
MATAKKPVTRRAAPVAEPAKCPDCKGTGEITETVRVGARKGRATTDQQAALCLTCLGAGQALD